MIQQNRMGWLGGDPPFISSWRAEAEVEGKPWTGMWTWLLTGGWTHPDGVVLLCLWTPPWVWTGSPLVMLVPSSQVIDPSREWLSGWLSFAFEALAFSIRLSGREVGSHLAAFDGGDEVFIILVSLMLGECDLIFWWVAFGRGFVSVFWIVPRDRLGRILSSSNIFKYLSFYTF